MVSAEQPSDQGNALPTRLGETPEHVPSIGHVALLVTGTLGPSFRLYKRDNEDGKTGILILEKLGKEDDASWTAIGQERLSRLDNERYLRGKIRVILDTFVAHLEFPRLDDTVR